MGDWIQKPLKMTPADWRAIAREAVESAVAWLDDKESLGRSTRITGAADLLRAAQTFEGRANMMENFSEPADRSSVETWIDDPSDEPIWPELSAKLREIAAADPKLLPMVETIDRLHELAVEKGFPVVTRGDFERGMAEVQ